MIGIDLFSGAGGMSLGAAQAGIDVLFAVESDPNAVSTYSKNHLETKVYCHDIRGLALDTLKELFKTRHATVVFGGPPCQGFSYSNLRTRSSDNPENWLFLEFVRVVRGLRPDWVVFENVRGIVNTANGIFLDEVVPRIEKVGYTVS